MGNTLLNQENIRRELLELTQQTASKAINDTDNTIAKFLKGEIELSIDKINELKTDFYNNWIKEKELTPWDEKVKQLLQVSTERKRDFQPLMNIAEDGKEALGKQWNKDDIFKFTNGTSETRARMFLSEGKGFTSLESPAYVPGEKYLSTTGLQIAPYGTGIGERSHDYARMQSSRFKDRPVIIEGEIPAQYVYRNTNGSAEFGIPHQYYDKISSAKILDAETKQELYHLDNGKLVKSETFTEPKLPELKIKELNKSVIQQSKPKTNNARLKLNTDSNGQYYFGDIQPEESIKVNEEVSIKNTDNNIKGQISFIDDNGNIKQEYKLTPQEAFDKYGQNDDRFYTSQGLDPKEQKEKINELNSKTKPIKTDKEILDDISIKPEEYDKVENNFKHIANELENLKNTTEEIVEETTENIQKELPKKQLTKASTEAIENNVKNINFKKVGKIGAIIGAIGLVSYGIGKHNENKKEEKQQIQYPQNNNYIDNSYAQQMASDISSYRYGKQMTGFIN